MAATYATELQFRQFQSEHEAIFEYFMAGFPYTAIVSFLALYQGIQMSIRTLKRRLREMNLRRRSDARVAPTDDTVLIRAIEQELQGTNSLVGYRTMYRCLRRKYGLLVTHNRVCQIMRQLAPQETARRRSRCLRRRVYYSEGPNFNLHVDGFDKIKPYGFCVHGAICGYSRRVMWLHVASSNNNPRLIANYYISMVEEIGGVSQNCISDRGSENVIMAALHTTLTNVPNSHKYVTSVRNQRIEAFWNIFKRNFAQWWMEFFATLINSGVWDPENELGKNCMQFCMMPVLQKEIDQFRSDWNAHRIRPSRQAPCPPGIPDVLHFLSHNDCLVKLQDETLYNLRDLCENEICEKQQCGNIDMEHYFDYIMQSNNLAHPRTAHEAVQMYEQIMQYSV